MAASKILLVLLFVVATCSCLEIDSDKDINELLLEEPRGKKKKTALRLLGTLLIVFLSKIAISKMFGGFFFWMFLQKMFTLAGWYLNYNLPKMSPPPSAAPVTEIGNHDYNTVGYSYGPPDNSYSPPEPSPPEQAAYGVPDYPYNRRKLIN